MSERENAPLLAKKEEESNGMEVAYEQHDDDDVIIPDKIAFPLGKLFTTSVFIISFNMQIMLSYSGLQPFTAHYIYSCVSL